MSMDEDKDTQQQQQQHGQERGQKYGQEHGQQQEQAQTPLYGSSRAIAAWTIAIMLGLVLVFFGRYFGSDNTPLSFGLSVAPLLGGVSGVLALVCGYFNFMKGIRTGSVMPKRIGMLFFVLGAFMIAGHFLFKQAVTIIFG